MPWPGQGRAEQILGTQKAFLEKGALWEEHTRSLCAGAEQQG